jgi:deazaflavin-dependent oxidoreductase (nitroreductase family)
VIARLASPAADWDAYPRKGDWPGIAAGPFPRDGGDEGGGMPIPRIVGQWNKAGLNRVTRHIAPWTPGFGVVIHRGRRSGRAYQTPVNMFATEDGYVLALTYGPDTDWVKNVLAAGGCELRTRGRVIRLVSPRLFHDQTRRAIRPLERQVLRVLGVADFLSLKTAPAATPAAGQP